MNLTSTNRLRRKIFEAGMTQTFVAENLGISYQTFFNKLHNKSEFKASEIKQICKILNIADKDAYFFAEDISQNG